MAADVQRGDRVRSPSGAQWLVETIDDGVAVLQLAVLPNGRQSTLANTQRYSRAELRACRGWEGVA